MLKLKLTIFILITLLSTSAFAWDWTCHPKDVYTPATKPPPNINILLDKSDSMLDGSLSGTCNVCEVTVPDHHIPGNRSPVTTTHTVPDPSNPPATMDVQKYQYKVADAAECGIGWPGETRTHGLYYDANGCWPEYFYVDMDITGAGSHFVLEVSIEGDYHSPASNAEVFVDGISKGRFKGGAAYGCGAPAQTKTFLIERSILSDPDNDPNTVHVRVQGNDHVHSWCDNDGTNTPLIPGDDGPNQTIVTVRAPDYVGSITNDAVCRVSKWDIVERAIDEVTRYSDYSTPQTAHFGLGVFSPTVAANVASCAASNNAEIMNQINLATPSAGSDPFTDFSHALTTAIAGSCFTDPLSGPTAGVLINDRHAWRQDATGANVGPVDSIVQACAHRNTAPLYVVGITDDIDTIKFNNILAAAGGSGSCDGGADPCDNPNNWWSYREICQGSFQTQTEAEVAAALSQVTSELNCTFDLSFTAPTSSVPEDTTNNYEYLFVDYIDAEYISDPNFLDKNVRIHHVDGPLATDLDADGIKDGYTFANQERTKVRFSQLHCGRIQTGHIVRTSTQLSCLCQESTGDGCIVPNAAALGVCPNGTWTCNEGIDVCEPATTCVSCTDGDPCTAPGGVGACTQGQVQCPVDSGVNGPIASGDLSFQVTSSDPSAPTVSHVLDGITVFGQAYTGFVRPDGFTTNFPSTMTSVRITENNIITSILSDNPAAFSAAALLAYQDPNLANYIDIGEEVTDTQYYDLTYNEPILSTTGRFVAVTERNSNNPLLLSAFDSSGSWLGNIDTWPSHYVGSGHFANSGQEIGIAVYAIDDLAPAGTEISTIRVWNDSHGASDAADGKFYVFGDIALASDGSGASSTCVATNTPATEICDGIDNDCDGTVDELDGSDCTVPNLLGRCQAGKVQCVDLGGGMVGSVCAQTWFPMPELCNGLDDDCNGQDDDISRSWNNATAAQKTAIESNNEDFAKACAYEDVCICYNGAMDNHAGDTFMSYVDEWDPECVCRALLEEDAPQTLATDIDGQKENTSSSEIVGCSAAGNGSRNLPFFLFLGFFLLIRRRT